MKNKDINNRYREEETELNEGEVIQYKVIVENISDKEINDLQVIAKIPQNTTFLESNEGWEYNKENNTISSNMRNGLICFMT